MSSQTHARNERNQHIGDHRLTLPSLKVQLRRVASNELHRYKGPSLASPIIRFYVGKPGILGLPLCWRGKEHKALFEEIVKDQPIPLDQLSCVRCTASDFEKGCGVNDAGFWKAVNENGRMNPDIFINFAFSAGYRLCDFREALSLIHYQGDESFSKGKPVIVWCRHPKKKEANPLLVAKSTQHIMKVFAIRQKQRILVGIDGMAFRKKIVLSVEHYFKQPI